MMALRFPDKSDDFLDAMAMHPRSEPATPSRRQMVLSVDMQWRRCESSPDASTIDVRILEEYTRVNCVESINVIDRAFHGDDLSAILDDVSKALSKKLAHEIETKLLVPHLQAYIRNSMELAKKGARATAMFPDPTVEEMVRRDDKKFLGIDPAGKCPDVTAIRMSDEYGVSVDVSKYMGMVGEAMGGVVDKAAIEALMGSMAVPPEKLMVHGEFIADEKVPDHKRHPSEITDDGDDVIIK